MPAHTPVHSATCLPPAGWHIECSAMIREVLGEVIDIHGGGRWVASGGAPGM